jgi:curved DNA-binding protein CbpA
VPKRSSYEVLGVDLDASAATIKARWRRLAREHHPDLTGGDGQASRAATRQMAEINAAYEELRDPARRKLAAERARAAGARAGRRDDGAAGAAHAGSNGTGPATAAGPGNAGPPRPRPGRPVTARLDTSDTYAPRNQTIGNHGRRAYRASNGPPFRAERKPAEPPRASDPTGPLRRARMRHFRPPPTPELAEAQACLVEFGKFRGHTLGEIAAFEPSYIDWIASTITKDRDLVAAARVIKDDLDLRGVPRVRRPPRPGPSPLP